MCMHILPSCECMFCLHVCLCMLSYRKGIIKVPCHKQEQKQTSFWLKNASLFELCCPSVGRCRGGFNTAGGWRPPCVLPQAQVSAFFLLSFLFILNCIIFYYLDSLSFLHSRQTCKCHRVHIKNLPVAN